MKKLFEQFIKFGLVGVSNTIISYIVYIIGIRLGWHYLLASIAGFIISVINSFYWNNRYVFRKEDGEQRSIVKAFIKTFLAYAGTGLVLNNVLLVLQVSILQVPKWLAPLLNLTITIPLNFVLNKIWAFKG